MPDNKQPFYEDAFIEEIYAHAGFRAVIDNRFFRDVFDEAVFRNVNDDVAARLLAGYRMIHHRNVCFRILMETKQFGEVNVVDKAA